MNIFTFTGNLGNDCAVKSTPSGTTVCAFSVAFKSGFGNNEKTSWARCTLFGKRAESNLTTYLKKGALVCISGEMSLDEWQGNDGILNKALSVKVQEIDVIGSKGSQQDAPVHQPATQPSAQSNFQAPDGFDDDIPF